jgi:hypothetical protein
MKIYDKIENMFPRYISDSEEYTTFVTFVKEYYKFLDSGIISYEIKPESGDVPYEIGDIVYGLSSGATATINSVSNGKLFVSSQSGFIDFEEFEISGSPTKPTSKLLSYVPGTAQVTDKLLEYRDIDQTPNNNIIKFFREFMAIIPYNLTEGIDKRKLLKEISSLYRVKGTEASIKILFKILSNSEASVYYPSIDILKVSDGKWTSETGLRCKRTEILDTFSSSNIGNIIGRKAEHPDSSGVVERVVKISDEIYDIILVKSSIRGEFDNAVADPRYPLLDQFIIVTGIDGRQYQFELLNVISNEDVKVDFSNTDWCNVSNNLHAITDEVTISVPNQPDSSYFPDYVSGSIVAIGSAYRRSDTSPIEYQVLLESGTGGLLFEDDDPVTQEDYEVSTIWPSNAVTWDYTTKTFNTNDMGNGWYSDIDNTGTGNHLYRCQVYIPSGSGTYAVAAGDAQWGEPHLIGSNAKAKLTTLTAGRITGINQIGSGGTGYVVGDIVTITSVEADTEVSAAKARVSSIGSSGTVTGLTLLYGGQGFQKNPNIVSGGSGTGLLLDLVDGDLDTHEIGCASEITITNPGQDYSRGNGYQPVISIYNPQFDDTNFISNNFITSVYNGVKVGKLFESKPRYLNADGFVSEERKRIRDGYYYQEYSYVIKTASPRSIWSNILKSSLHPAGLLFFSEFLIPSLVDVSVTSLCTNITLLDVLTGGPSDYGYIFNDPIAYNHDYGDFSNATTYSDYSDLT